jgi:pectate lyase
MAPTRYFFVAIILVAANIVSCRSDDTTASNAQSPTSEGGGNSSISTAIVGGAGGKVSSNGGKGGTAASGGRVGGKGGSTGKAGSRGVAGQGGAGGKKADNGACATASGELIGWASVSGNGVTTTTGGEGGPTISVSDIGTLENAVKGTNKQVIEIRGSIEGDIAIGSNKTLVGVSSGQFKGHITLSKSANVIIRNLTIVGYNCADSPSDCSGGADAITVNEGSHHLWFDHDDISDGSDGNLDLTQAVDYVTVSWTKFHYSGRRTDPAGATGGHRFSTLIGHSDDNASQDTGHLRITFHHNWWADNVVERMPRVRFGQVHIFNNLYTASGNDYCIGVGVNANILTENNLFIGVRTPINTSSYTNSASAVRSTGNRYTSTTGTAPVDLRADSVFDPPYAYSLDDTSCIESAIRNGAGS